MMTLGVLFCVSVAGLMLSYTGLHGSGVLIGGALYGVIEITVKFRTRFTYTYLRTVNLCVPNRIHVGLNQPSSVHVA